MSRSFAICAWGCLLGGLLGWTALLQAAEELREWSDASGKYKIEATLLSTTGTKVKLKQKTGKTVEIELSKLSQADQDYVASIEDNPFKESPPGENPFEAPGDAPAMEKPTDAGTGEERTVQVDWDDAETILLQAEGEWKAEVGAHPGLGLTPKPIALPPKADFFEGTKGLAVSKVAQRAIVGYVMGGPNRDGGIRLVMCDLKTGKMVASANAPGKLAPIALHDDGQQILMRRDEFGFGNLDRLEVWTMEGKNIRKSLSWTPYENVQGADRDVLWAEFLDAEHLATGSRGGRVVIWDFATAKPICMFNTTNGATPALSGDRQWIAFCNGERFGLFSVKERKVVAMEATPAKLTWPGLAFSPSGTRLGCVAQDRILVWETATGKLIQDFQTPGLHINGPVSFPDDSFLLANNKYLIDLENRIKLWEYNGAEQLSLVGSQAIAVVGSHNGPGALLTVQLPHQAAKQMLQKALTDPELFVFKSGTTVKLDVTGIPEADQEHVRESLTRKLGEMSCEVGDAGTIRIVAKVTGPQEREISYFHSGDYKVQEYLTTLTFDYQGQAAWQTSSSNIPGMLWLKKGENIEGVLRKASEKPNISFYDGVVLPKFLQKPTSGQGVNGRQTLGASNLTTSGIQ